MRSFFQEAGRISYNSQAIIDTFYDNRAGTDADPTTDGDAFPYSGSDADPSSFTDPDPAGQVRAGRDMDSVSKVAVMVNCRTRIHNDSLTNAGADIDDRSRENDRPDPQGGI
jgi:hypothetical protein